MYRHALSTHKLLILTHRIYSEHALYISPLNTVGLPPMKSENKQHILVQNVCCHEAHIPVKLAGRVNCLLMGQRAQPRTRTLIQQTSRLRNADPLQKPEVVQWQPIFSRGLSVIRRLVCNTAKGACMPESHDARCLNFRQERALPSQSPTRNRSQRTDLSGPSCTV